MTSTGEARFPSDVIIRMVDRMLGKNVYTWNNLIAFYE
jgi:hypothetical protein